MRQQCNFTDALFDVDYLKARSFKRSQKYNIYLPHLNIYWFHGEQRCRIKEYLFSEVLRYWQKAANKFFLKEWPGRLKSLVRTYVAHDHKSTYVKKPKLWTARWTRQETLNPAFSNKTPYYYKNTLVTHDLPLHSEERQKLKLSICYGGLFTF